MTQSTVRTFYDIINAMYRFRVNSALPYEFMLSEI